MKSHPILRSLTLTSVILLLQIFSQSTNAKVVEIGDNLPDVDLYEDNPTNKVNLAELTAKKMVIIFGVPGAFSPGCSKSHLPGFVRKADEFKQKGVDEIICVSVNDAFVMGAWAKAQNTTGKVRMLADPTAALAKALDLTIDIEAFGGLRSKRFSLVAENGKITQLHIEPDGVSHTVSSADNIEL